MPRAGSANGPREARPAAAGHAVASPGWPRRPHRVTLAIPDAGPSRSAPMPHYRPVTRFLREPPERHHPAPPAVHRERRQTMAPTAESSSNPSWNARTTPAPPLLLKPGTSWQDAWQRSLAAAPEAFRDDRVLNLWAAAWQPDGRPLPATSPVDGTPIAGPPRLDAAAALPRGTGLPRPAPGLAPRPARPNARRGHRRAGRADRTPRTARPAAGLGDRQAVEARAGRRRPVHRGRALVRRRDRPDARRPHPAARPGQQHRQLELPDVAC